MGRRREEVDYIKISNEPKINKQKQVKNKSNINIILIAVVYILFLFVVFIQMAILAALLGYNPQQGGRYIVNNFFLDIAIYLSYVYIFNEYYIKKHITGLEAFFTGLIIFDSIYAYFGYSILCWIYSKLQKKLAPKKLKIGFAIVILVIQFLVGLISNL